MARLHTTAATGFEAGAEAYARGRPDYPAELLHWLRESIHLGPGTTVLDLGAGTGKFIGLLVRSGASVTAVEPVNAMRARLVSDWPGVVALDGTAEAIPLADTSMDAVVSAQAFHWFSTPAAVAEIRRVLKPGGVFGLVWNTADLDVRWVAQLRAMIQPYEGDTPRFHSGEWKSIFPAEGFGPLVESQFRHEHVGAPESVIVHRMMSVSYVASLSAGERAALSERMRTAIAANLEVAGKAEVHFPYKTFAYATTKL